MAVITKAATPLANKIVPQAAEYSQDFSGWVMVVVVLVLWLLISMFKFFKGGNGDSGAALKAQVAEILLKVDEMHDYAKRAWEGDLKTGMHIQRLCETVEKVSKSQEELNQCLINHMNHDNDVLESIESATKKMSLAVNKLTSDRGGS